ncbi:MAG TPA: hypothetical protein VF160_03755 [Candidatus Dormibacteraeota bacterium]
MRGGSAAGHAAELLVQAALMMGSGYKLGCYQPGIDDDHKDIVVVEKGGFSALYVQVKSTAQLDREGRVVCMADYPEGAVPESPRFVYVMTLIDEAQQRMARCWLVGSVDFNRLAYRQHSAERPGRVVLQFSCVASGDAVWDGFEVAPLALGAAVERLLETAAEDTRFDVEAVGT